LGVDCPSALLVVCALCRSERPLIFLEMSQVRDLGAIGQSGQRIQSEIDADFANAASLGLGNFHLKTDIPAAACILRETSGFDLTVDRAAVPKPIAPPEVGHRIAIDLDGASGDEGYPAEGFSAAP